MESEGGRPCKLKESIDTHHYIRHTWIIAPVINNSFHGCKNLRSPRYISPAHMNFHYRSSLWCMRHCGVWLYTYYYRCLKLHEIVCTYARCAVISPATFFPRSARITRNNYCRNDAGNKPAYYDYNCEEQWKIMCTRWRESRQINIYYFAVADNRWHSNKLADLVIDWKIRSLLL